jgi:integrase
VVHYSKHGKPIGTHENYRPCLRLLRRECGDWPVSAFGPKALKALREKMRLAGNSRRYMNDNADRIRRVFRWGVSEELVPAEVLARLDAVEGVRSGSAGVVEHPPVEPVSDVVVEATLPFLPSVVRDMVRVQRLCGCRPGEVCILRPQDIDRSSEPWIYRPYRHKTEHRGKQRLIFLGPKAQAILLPYLTRNPQSYCFSPADSERLRNAARREQRQTPLPKTKQAQPVARPRARPPLAFYTNDSYRRAIERACDKAFPPPKGLKSAELKAWRKAHRWAPNQLRHAAATEICARTASLVAAKEALGHSSVRTTENYVQPQYDLARRIIQEIG